LCAGERLLRLRCQRCTLPQAASGPCVATASGPCVTVATASGSRVRRCEVCDGQGMQGGGRPSRVPSLPKGEKCRCPVDNADNSDNADNADNADKGLGPCSVAAGVHDLQETLVQAGQRLRHLRAGLGDSKGVP
jgi:hypothetical protein